MDILLWLVIFVVCSYWVYRLLTTPHPAWKYMTDDERAFYRKWFVYPRLWRNK